MEVRIIPATVPSRRDHATARGPRYSSHPFTRSLIHWAMISDSRTVLVTQGDGCSAIVEHSWSSYEGFIRVLIDKFGQQWLFVRGTPAQGATANAILVESYFAAEQAIHPVPVNENAMAQQAHLALLVATAHVDQGATQWLPQVEMPDAREGPPLGSATATVNATLAVGVHIAPRLLLQRGQIGKVKALPYFGLVQAVEAFDRVLQAEFQWGHEYRNYVQGQTQPNNTAETIGKAMRALEAGIVVKLNVRGHAQLLPARLQTSDHLDRPDLEARPRIHDTAMQRGGGEHRYLWPLLQLEIFNHIQTIELSATRRHCRQMPATRRSRMPYSPPGIDLPMAAENATNRRHRRRVLPRVAQRLGNGHGTELAQHAVLTQRSPRIEHLPFYPGRRPVPRLPRAAFAPFEVDAIQPLTVHARDPRPYRRRAHPKLPRYCAQCHTFPHRLHHRTTSTCQRGAFLPMITSSLKKTITVSKCSGIADHWLFGNC